MKRFLEAVGSFLNVELFVVAGTSFTGMTLLLLVAIVTGSFLLSRAIRHATERAFAASGATRDAGTVSVIQRMVHYLVLVVGLGVGLHLVGFNFSSLFAAGAVFAVAFGFAMQTITQNFVSGLILLSERTIKPGDIIELEGQFLKIRDMGIRVTVARTLDDEDLIIPNGVLAQAIVKNFTFRDSLLRVRVLVGVAYTSDLRLVRKVLETTAAELGGRLPEKAPIVYLSEFGASSVDFEVSVWISDPWSARRCRSQLREAIWWAFRDAGITIAFPQVDVHFDPEVVEGVLAAGGREV